MNVRPAGREACECASPINQILERLDQMDADIASAQQAANTAVGTATAQAGAAAASAASAHADAAAALINAGAAQDAADDAHDEAVAAAASAQDAADDAADALLALQNIESTIASVLATDIGAKVDKLTTAGFHLYTHNGSTQGEVAPDINPTAATIPIRDSSGKLFGADPASGATDKTLVTANWVSQTGDTSPNNLVHKGGTETIPGRKVFTDQAVMQKTNYPLFHTIVTSVLTASGGSVSQANASGIQYYSGDTPNVYLGRNCITYDNNTKRASHDLRINSIINSGINSRLLIEEKSDGTFSLSFWNGQAWTRLVQ